MFSPVSASSTNDVAVNQWAKRSYPLKRENPGAGAAGRERQPHAQCIGKRQPQDRTEDDNGACPSQKHLVEIAPRSSGGLYQGPGCVVQKLNSSFDAP